MSINRKMIRDEDFEEALQREAPIRVFQDNHIIDSNAIVIRYDDHLVVTQSGVSEVSYHNRQDCEFFLLKKNR